MKIMLQAILHELVINLGSKYDGRQFCRMTKYGREFTILTTKYAHIFAKKHYGVDVFEGDDKNCPSGIEVDAESDYSRTIDKRLLRTRLFYSDIGTYNFFGLKDRADFHRVTDATMALLQDSGNFMCNWSMASPLVWGNPESELGGKFIKDFAIGPPKLVFPKGYEFKDSNYFKFTHYDYKMGSRFEPPQMKANLDCTNDTSYYCRGFKFYNPFNESYISMFRENDHVDFISAPQVVCPKGMALLPGNNSPQISIRECGYYKCNKYDSFTYYIPNSAYINFKPLNITCNKTNIGQKFYFVLYTIMVGYWQYSERDLICPDPELFCRRVKLYDMNFVRDPSDLESKQLDDPYANTTDNVSDKAAGNSTESRSQIGKALSWAVLSVTIVTIFVITGFIIYYKKKDLKDDTSADARTTCEKSFI